MTGEQRALADALRSEHAAIYAYGLVSAYLLPPGRVAAVAATTAHQARRDALTAALVAQGSSAPVAAPGYLVPVTVTDAVTAAQLAVTIESDTAVAWRGVLENSAAQPATVSPAAGFDVRASAVAALTDCAVRAAGWRAAAGIVPVTTAFPGQPGPG